MMRRGTHQVKKHHGAPKPPADLLVCFPTRAHLTIKPKQICSPARLSDPTGHHTKHLTKLSSARFRTDTSSPVSWAKDKRAGLDGSEPSSPKVTCAGQIKVRRKSADSSWQSVMEEIERIQIKNKRQKKRASWGDALGFKKEVMQFLTCLRTIKLDFRCFGAMPECDISSDEEDDEEEDGREHGKDEINQMNSEEEEDKEADKSSGTKWVVFLQENQDTREAVTNHVDQESESLPTAPPNALLLMRCRSAPAKSWLETRAREIVEQEERDKKAQQQQQQQDKEEEEMFEKTETEENQKKKKKLRDYLVVMDYDTDFYKLSNDIANETWVVGSINPNNPFSRSRSCKR